jgi:outer membrane protein insertion porin family
MKTLLRKLPTRFLLTQFGSIAICLGLLCSAATAQTQPTGSATAAMPASAYKLIEVKVAGSKRFTQDEVAAASGLPVGTTAHDEDFRKAARHLGETGVFASIAFTYSYSSAGTRLTFQVTDADKFVPARFADFVWFPDQDLRKKIHERVPLFNGELPTTGRLPDQVSDVLQALLVENGIPGHVDYLRTSGETGQLEAIDYSVSNVTIRVHHVEFIGSGAGELPLLQTAAEKLSTRQYSRALLNSFVEHALLPIYHERGYLKAACAPPQLKVVKPDASEENDGKHEETLVDVTFPITPGIPYKLSRWEWSGNKAIPTDSLQPLLHLKAGQTANTVQLEDDLRTIQILYSSQGYILATVKADAVFDDVSGTIDYHLAVNEGSVYHMGELGFRGIDNNLEARLRAAWKLRPGDVYDATYLQQFLPQARKLLPPTIDWDVSTHVTALPRDKTVDVDLQYMAKAPK